MTRGARAADDAPATGVRRSRLSTDLASAVVEMISADGLVAGQAIPALRPLSERFGVAVPTMREALRRLEGMEILEFRHGSGIYVGPNSERLVMANQLAPRPTEDQLVQLLQARQVIEPPIAALAAQMRATGGLRDLDLAVRRARVCLDERDARLSVANLDIHRTIAAATGNPVLSQLLDSLATVHADDQAKILLLHGAADADHAEHVTIVERIVAGDAEGARASMHDHLAGVIDVVRRRIAAT